MWFLHPSALVLSSANQVVESSSVLSNIFPSISAELLQVYSRRQSPSQQAPISVTYSIRISNLVNKRRMG